MSLRRICPSYAPSCDDHRKILLKLPSPVSSSRFCCASDSTSVGLLRSTCVRCAPHRTAAQLQRHALARASATNDTDCADEWRRLSVTSHSRLLNVTEKCSCSARFPHARYSSEFEKNVKFAVENPREARVHVRRIAELSERQQQHVTHLEKLVKRHTLSSILRRGSGEVDTHTQRERVTRHTSNPVFVACGVWADASSSSTDTWGAENRSSKGQSSFPTSSGVSSSSEWRSFIGVNYAIHSQANQHSVLSGLLKGCAEQNALGALAASGTPYSAVREAFLCSSLSVSVSCSSSPLKPAACTVNRSSDSRTDNQEKKQVASQTSTSPQAHRCAHMSQGFQFPCPECWNHFTNVSRLVRDTHTHPGSNGVAFAAEQSDTGQHSSTIGEPPRLRLYIHAQDEDAAERGMEEAHKRLSNAQHCLDIFFVIPDVIPA